MNLLDGAGKPPPPTPMQSFNGASINGGICPGGKGGATKPFGTHGDAKLFGIAGIKLFGIGAAKPSTPEKGVT